MAQTDDIDAAERDRLATLFYARSLDPALEGEVHFLRHVPLIAPAPDCAPSSQYWTSLVIYARRTCRRLFFEHVEKAFRVAAKQDATYQGLPERAKSEVPWRIINEALGPLDDSLIPPDLRKPAGHQRVQAAAAPHAPDEAGVETAGAYALRTVDARLKRTSDHASELRSLLHTKAVRWQVIRREKATMEQCVSNLRRHSPFISHRDNNEYLICGFARHEDTLYLMGFNLAQVEKRIVLGTGGISVPYSEFLRIRDEAHARDPNIKFRPLVLDYGSYFSVKNLSAFRILPARPVESISALYPEEFDEDAIRRLITSEFEKAAAAATPTGQGR